MSQATFDPTTPGGPSDDSGETRGARTPSSGARRRPTRRGHAAAAKSTETTTQPTTPAEAAAPTITPATPERETSAAPVAAASAPAQPTVPATEEAARGESRRRSRGGAKRPAARGKAGAQLIIAKTGDEAQADATQTEAPAAETAATMVAAAEAPTAEPMIVPVVTSGAEPAQPATPRKTRFGLPRRLRQPEAEAATPPSVAPAAPVAPPVAEPVAVAEQAAAAEPATPAEPARRYRFDRSRSTTIPGVAWARPERLSRQQPGLYTGAAESAAEPIAEPTPEPHPATEPLFALPPLESLVGGGAAELPTLAFEEPAAPTALAPEVTEEAERLEEAGEAGEQGEGEGEGAGGVSRRRRRRRRGTAAHNGAHGAELEEAAEEEGQPTAEGEPLEAGFFGEVTPEPTEEPYQEPQRETRGYGERGRTGRFGYTSRTPRRPAAEPAWEPAPQQPAAETSPYSSPEPSFARGFGPTPNGVAAPMRESYPRPSRIERGADTSAASVAQLGSVIREAISTQTDRLLSELRRQQPPAVTLSIPNAQTAERVAVFVDVANVVYSARNLRTSVDFGHLLDFLRANRRLARAQAYAPTNPEPGAEQAFLSAVKGLGYRITTKNYKTFSNGAKKADLDLDLCMDIVRIVEAKAVDTIVLVSGDSDFLPLLDYCSDHGVRVEVAAFDDAASMILRQSCDLFVNLSLVEGIRG